MIPMPVAPLKGVVVLVTRPLEQSKSLCAAIDAQGGESIEFPTIAIEPIESVTPPPVCDWIVFISVHAVRFGLRHVQRGEHTRIAAIGKATESALASNDIRVDAVSTAGSTSEALLAHPAFANVASQSVLIVKGVGGRELLQDELQRRNANVSTYEVYRRVKPDVAAAALQSLEQQWLDERIDIVTLTSVETLVNLLAMLSPAGRRLLASTPIVPVSERIASAARERGLEGAIVMARGADDAAIVGAIAAWHARAR